MEEGDYWESFDVSENQTTVTKRKGNITQLAWKDEWVVTLLSTWNNSGMTSTKRYIRGGTEVIVSKPNVVFDYTHSMGGVDRADQCGSIYCFLRKSLKSTEVHFSDAPTQKCHGVVALLSKKTLRVQRFK
ncbi:hypothetical protein GQX74_010054 [Glossina fuscipes]|nr:hypothetical protein GQX74_010054 [Glossina fuscipes]